MRTRSSSLLLFGATGDLARRMLLPSLFGLDRDGLLPERMRIIGTAHTTLDDAGFRRSVTDALEQHGEIGRSSSDDMARFLSRLSYVQLDVRDPRQFETLAESVGRTDEPIAIFLSTAPSLFSQTIMGLADAGLAGESSRLALEKPLGSDFASSCAINDVVANAFSEARTFRLDHYLGKETVQNLIALRFANALFEPLWNARGIEHVQITVSETVGLEGRAGYFDGMGSLRDMVQNHMLQLLALVAMEPPGRFEPTAVRDEKVKVLRALRKVGPRDSVTGQYVAGAIGGAAVAGYAEELGKSSDTETFVAIKAHVDNWRWKGVPFYLRTGKRLPVRRSEIVIQFKQIPHSIFGDAPIQANRLVIELQPDENIRLLMMAKQPGLDRSGIRLRQVPLDLGVTDAFADARRRIAYERLLLDLIEGDPTLFVRRDEVEAQWTWIDAIRAGWTTSVTTPRPYAAGTWGPSAAIALAERDGVSWHE
ncbi:glucose-6-phosphate dehydrogenase [Flavisphingomonas formosensis]|uniref:glucose-6-phosphate dehydrogenase n=1 Tax=Flavisphingomonas formosensis TaxID=861534 RepID=UPI0012FB84E1|nr:glucose-6-phosphate dehydrogenase [Sphingomonas formosensis]